MERIRRRSINQNHQMNESVIVPTIRAVLKNLPFSKCIFLHLSVVSRKDSADRKKDG